MAYGLQGSIRRSRGVIRHPYCRVFKLKKSKKRKIRIFEKPDFPVRIRIRWFRSIRGVTLRSQEVHRSEKMRKKNFPENPDFPDPDFRISSYGVANGAERATCGQNFSPLTAVVPEIFGSLTIIIYWMRFEDGLIWHLWDSQMPRKTRFWKVHTCKTVCQSQQPL